jgi:membrane carboxypeptidase/penicillin-binding protein PbpC
MDKPLVDRSAVPTQAPQRSGAGTPAGGAASRRSGTDARQQDLLHRARAEDVLHWQQNHRPISAENLRKRLRVGAPTARQLVTQLRSDLNSQIEGQMNDANRKDQPTE